MKSKIISLLILFVLIFSTKTMGQFITLPDTVFANFIANTYPAIVNSSKQLDTNAAKTITGIFSCKWNGISDATGLQYFQGLTKIYLTGNKLTSIPDLSRTTGLTYLVLDTNKITSLPPLNSLSNLQSFTCRVNLLDSIPSLAGLSNLATVMVDHNKLTKIPDVTGCTALWHLIVSDNSISSLPDMSSLSALKRFLLTNNPLITADLTSIPNLQQVHLIYTGLIKFPKLKGTQFTEIRLNKNSIDSLPDLSAFTGLSIFEIQDNKLTFEDLLPLSSHPNFSSFKISPQATIGTAQTLELKIWDPFTWDIGIDKSLTSNIFSWYRDTTLILTNNTGIFKIDSVTFPDAGTYTVQVRNSNPKLSSLVLNSFPVHITMITCFDASNLSITISNNNCKFPLSVFINESEIIGGYPPFTYTIVNSTNRKQTSFFSASLTIPQEGAFDLQIKDSKGCAANLKNKILVTRNERCDPVIYPDSQGPESSYYIENSGRAVIYNLEGNVVRSLNIPAYWDGSNEQGALVGSGLYMIVINDQIKIQMSVIRKN